MALAAYAAYVVNAVQFLRKFQLARSSSTGSLGDEYIIEDVPLVARL